MLKTKQLIENEKNVTSYFKDISKCTPLSREEEYELWDRYKHKNDMSAKNKLISSNLKFVAYEARKFQGMGLPYSDLIAEGNLGLIKGIERFDGAKGNKIISYSVWWIRQTIIEALKKRNGLEAEELPVDYKEQNLYDSREENEYESDEIATAGEFIIEEYDNRAKEKEMSETVSLILGSLTDREKFIVTEYYGIGKKKPKTLEDIGKSLNLTKERIRQILEVATKKMRNECMYLNVNQDIYK